MQKGFVVIRNVWSELYNADTCEPSSVAEALKDERWVSVMNNEHTTLIKNKTWHLVPP
jgi:hypothetical protein